MYTQSSRQHQWKFLDSIRRSSYVRFEIKRSILKALLRTPTLPLGQRYYALYRKALLPRSSSITRVVNRCVHSGRKYSTLRRYGMSRFVFRVQSYEGHLPGVRRHSW